MDSACVVKWNQKQLYYAVREAEGLEAPLREAVNLITSRANAMSSSYRTKTFYRNGEKVGNTQPRYEGDVGPDKRFVVGIVYPKNYAAMKDTLENNTLLKAGGVQKWSTP